MTEIAELTEEQLQELLERLAFYALRKFQKLGWATKHTGCAGPYGKGPEDIASEAIIQVLNGKRKYNPEKYSTFMNFLRSAVDSRISHLADTFKRKKMVPLSVVTNNQEDGEEIEFEGKESTPVTLCMNKDIVEKVKITLAKDFKGDTVVSGLIECFEAGYTKPAEISEVLGIDIKEIYNAQKRLQRAVDKNLQSLKMEHNNGK